MTDISKTDWTIFKDLRERALERFCSRVLDEIARISSDQAKSSHDRYLAICRLVQERDREIDPIFDYLRRSSAVTQLCAFRARDLVTDEEFKSLSPELRRRIEHILRTFNEPLEIVDENDDADPRQRRRIICSVTTERLGEQPRAVPIARPARCIHDGNDRARIRTGNQLDARKDAQVERTA